MFTGEIIGYLGADAKVTTKDEKTVISFSVSSNNKQASEEEKPTWISCFYNRSSGISEFLKKGTMVYVCGDLNISLFQKDNGEVLPSVKLIVSKIELLPTKRNDK